MTKNELIEKLQALPGNGKVFACHWKGGVSDKVVIETTMDISASQICIMAHPVLKEKNAANAETSNVPSKAEGEGSL